MVPEPQRTRTDAETETTDGRSSRRPLSTRPVALGLEGGVVATVVMTAFRVPITGSLPPTADFLATYVGGGNPDDYTLAGLVVHLLYGMIAGGVFAVFAGRLLTGSEAEREKRGVLAGFAYGLVLSGFGVRVVLERLLEMELEPDERWIFHVSHVVYGLTLGSWLGSKR